MVVVGAGNAGFESAAQLLAYCKSVTLLVRGPEITRADAATVEAVMKHPNMHVLFTTEPTEVVGKNFVSGIVVHNKVTNETNTVAVTGIFVEIGMTAATDLVADLVERDTWGRIKVDGKSQRTSCLGIWSAGDCSDALYHQNNIAAGDAVKALEDIYYYVKSH